MRSLFEPGSIAVVGAARDERKVGSIILRNLLSSGFEGDLYPVNPNADEVQGMTCYADLTRIPGHVDLAVIVVPARLVPDVMRQAGEKGVGAAIVISAGFREVGREGMDLEREVLSIARGHGIRVVGPNCFGVMNTHWGMNATFTSLWPRKGPIGFSSQSGAVGSTLLDWSLRSGAGFSKFVSVGNKMDVDEVDLIRHLRDDDDTGVIGLYIEGLDRGRLFLDEAMATTSVKPVIALKSGRTSTGARAASSHTGAISGSDGAYDAAFRQAGVIRVDTIDDFYDLLLLFSHTPMPKGGGVALVSNAGGLGVLAADACSTHGVTMATLEERTVSRLREMLPHGANVLNPVDVLGDADVERLDSALRVVMDDANVGSVIVLTAPVDTVDIESVASLMADRCSESPKPMLTAFVGGRDCESGREILRSRGVPNFDSPSRAIKALSALIAHSRRSSRAVEAPILREGDVDSARAVVDAVLDEGRVSLTEEEGKRLLRAYGIPTPEEGVARTEAEAVSLARRMGYPLVMKISSPDIPHKTDVGGVVLDVRSEEAVVESFHSIMANCRARVPGARVKGVSVQRMAEGREVLVSVVRDHQFGPVVTLGAGGIFVEVMHDIAQRIAPLTASDVDEMIRSLRYYPILMGARGRDPADIDSIREALARISQMAMDIPEVYELEMNPVMVGDQGGGLVAVDALVTLRGEGR